LLVIYHPTTTTFGGEQKQMEELLSALDSVGMPTILLWPNIDAGSDRISKTIRVFRERTAPTWLRTLINLEPENYLQVLAGAACAVGNSSSFVRDASFFGTPVVLVGDRQGGREIDAHVTPVPPVASGILDAIHQQLEHGRYAPSTLYGDGWTAQAICDALVGLTPYVQKRLHYIHDEAGHDAGYARRREAQFAATL
jgi:GDP/UDP-N,N'-diacetylbacillosamine 2-epimerase (hydrolysing)